MPILAVDQMGRIYQTSGDRSDGLGFGSYPEASSQSDLTLGNAFLKAQTKRTQDVLKQKRAQEAYDRAETAKKAFIKMKQNDELKKQEAHAEMMRHPDAHAAILKRAHSQGYSGGNKTAFGGNALTANGMSGFAGMSRDQQIIHHAVLGMGSNTAPKADPRLERMRAERARADQMLRLTASPGRPVGKTRV